MQPINQTLLIYIRFYDIIWVLSTWFISALAFFVFKIERILKFVIHVEIDTTYSTIILLTLCKIDFVPCNAIIPAPFISIFKTIYLYKKDSILPNVLHPTSITFPSVFWIFDK